ncbi:MAG: class I SAM-dependent methyltransferase [Nitrospirota bacterium]|nr:class I SAM-dependent methyltransferase [Nitrospirota bacterium]
MNQEWENKIDLNSEKCPLCKSADVHRYYSDKQRKYLWCGECYLVFVPAAYFLSEQQEKQRYDIHQNSPEDQNYRTFLDRTFLPMQKMLLPGSCGLDFGSGPGPTLSVMFQDAGHKVSIYDYFYAQNMSVFQKKYDFITATEVLEHLHHPQKELDRLWRCLKRGGTLGIMTKLVLNREAFYSWHYKNDPTHVCFYSKPTFRWLASRWQAEIDFIDKDVIFFYKRSAKCKRDTGGQSQI